MRVIIEIKGSKQLDRAAKGPSPIAIRPAYGERCPRCHRTAPNRRIPCKLCS
jgi:hypothetical protein